MGGKQYTLNKNVIQY